MDNLFEQAADMARVQAEGYRQVRERARNEALEEAARVCDKHLSNAEKEKGSGNPLAIALEVACMECASDIRALKERT